MGGRRDPAPRSGGFAVRRPITGSPEIINQERASSVAQQIFPWLPLAYGVKIASPGCRFCPAPPHGRLVRPCRCRRCANAQARLAQDFALFVTEIAAPGGVSLAVSCHVVRQHEQRIRDIAQVNR